MRSTLLTTALLCGLWASSAAHAAPPIKSVTLPSGVVVTMTKEGTGARPHKSSVVKVHYRGTLMDSTEFDSSYQRGKPAEFRLDRVIPCWTEGMKLLRVGASARLTCPAETAYGVRGAPPKIGSNQILQFDVELLDILG